MILKYVLEANCQLCSVFKRRPAVKEHEGSSRYQEVLYQKAEEGFRYQWAAFGV